MAQALPVPKYHQIYLVLREQLHEGVFAQGLPGELALMRQFGVARVTVRRALQELAGEGLIARERGRGTRPVVAAEARRGAGAAKTTHLSGLPENIVSMTENTTVRVLEVSKVAAAGEVAQVLQLAAGDLVQKAVRVRSTREGPLSHITTWLPGDLASHFGRRELARTPIL